VVPLGFSFRSFIGQSRNGADVYRLHVTTTHGEQPSYSMPSSRSLPSVVAALDVGRPC
jgi:hypothetical protein